MSHRLTVTAAIATVLASVALYSLVSGGRWFWTALGAAAVVAVLGTLTRLRVLPVVLCAAASLAGLVLYLNILFAGPESWARVAPTRSSLHHLWWLAQQGMAESSKFTPPVAPHHGILLLTVAGIGIAAAATDLLAVRLRQPAIAGLPLLVLFCVPLTTSAHRSGFGATAVFCLGMMGYLGLLAADGRERLRLWGRLVTLWQAGPQDADQERIGPNTKELAASGRRIGLAAVVLALFIPLIVPGLRDHKLFPGHGGGTAGEFISLPDPLAQMNNDLHRSRAVDVLSYHTTDPAPQYLQVYVLDKLGTTSWTMTSAVGDPVRDGRLPRAPGLDKNIRTSAEHTKITLANGLTSSQKASFLPLPYPAQDVRVDGDWHVDRRALTLFSAQDNLSGLGYTATTKEVDPSVAQLERAGTAPISVRRGDLDVPAAFSKLLPLAERITHGQTSGYGQAVALQRWFTTPGRFTYSLNVGEPHSASALIRFLTKARRGYCQQFAFAMAVLARLLDIPARVAIGYTPGSFVGNGQWQVRTSDAHAWPELYFQDVGWLRFEPTPAGSGGQSTASIPTYTLPQQAVNPTVPLNTPTPGVASAQPKASAAGSGLNAKLQHLGVGPQGGKGHGGNSIPVGVLLAAILGLALVTPRSARSLTRRRRWLTAADDSRRAHVAWQELLDDLADHGFPCPASESPRALAARVGSTLQLAPAENEAVERIARAEESAHYAREPASPATLRADVSLVRRAVSRASGRPTRWHARVLPASALAPMRRGLQHALDVFGWMDMVTLRQHDRPRRGTVR